MMSSDLSRYRCLHHLHLTLTWQLFVYEPSADFPPCVSACPFQTSSIGAQDQCRPHRDHPFSGVVPKSVNSTAM